MKKLEAVYNYMDLDFKKKLKKEKEKVKEKHNQKEKIEKDNENIEYIEFSSKLEPKIVKKIKLEPISQKLMTPWLSQSTKIIKEPMLRFHNEIIDFFNYIKPIDAEHNLRLKTIEK